MNRYLKIIFTVCTTAYALGAARELLAADVRVGLSARETYVGLPVILRIQIAGAAKVEPPTLPQIDGVAVKSLGNPSRNTQITTINGHTTTTTTQVFAFELTPQHSGTFQIPAVAISADGAAQHTRPVEFVATKSETGDLMFVEIAGKEKQIYVGQALHLTLKIWLRPYIDANKKITLSEADMWKMISDRSEWGPFAERIQVYADQNRRPSGAEVLRKDRDGVEHSYYLYQIEATIYPKRPGKIDGDNVKLIADYPTALGRARDPFAGFFDDMSLPGGRPPGFGDDDFSLFGSRLVVQSVRPVAAQADVEPIDVLPIPTAGRPSDYRGAVGTYHIAVDASPTHVKAGDPINLFIGISGSGPMELVQSPPLAEAPDLTADFKVPNEPLAGFVKGDRKIFQTTIRPRKPGIAQIPPIPFSFFDPAESKFVTVHSAPVSIQVDPAEMLALDGKTPGSKEKDSASSRTQTARADNSPMSLEVFTGDDLLIHESAWSPDGILWILLFTAPPIAVLTIFLRSRVGITGIGHWFRSAINELQRELTNASRPAEIGAALERFATRNYKRSGANADAESIIGAMRAAGARDLAIRFETLLNECGDVYRPTELQGERSLIDLKLRAQQWANDAQSFSRRAMPKRIPRSAAAPSLRASFSSAQPISLAVLAVVAASCALLSQRPATAETPVINPAPSAEHSQPIRLNEQQQKAVLNEAATAYTTALDKLKQDSDSAKVGFEKAAEKYQLLVDAGIENSRLYFNVANAYLESGQITKAIVNYRRSLRINPSFHAAETNLIQAQQRLNHSPTFYAQESSQEPVSGFSSTVSRWLIRSFTLRQLLAAMALAWFALWAVIACRLHGLRFPWKTSVIGLGLVTLLLGISLSLIWPTSGQRLAVVIQAEPAATKSENTPLREGQVVEVIQQRPETVRVRTANGQELWLPASAVDLI